MPSSSPPSLLISRSSSLVVGRDVVAIRREGLTVDAREFQDIAQRSILVEHRRAIDLYRGDFLADLDLLIEHFGSWRKQQIDGFRAVVADRYEKQTRARRMTFAASPVRPFEVVAAEVTFDLQASDDEFNSGGRRISR